MKLIVQIPCYNEELTLSDTVSDIPRDIEGVDKVEFLVIDDGSTDDTVAVAEQLEVDHIIINKKNMGLAYSFKKGIDVCLAKGADIIVNTDGDNQYAGKDIPALIQPILNGKADIVVGNRQTEKIEHFSLGKKILQKLGSGLVKRLSGVNIPDAVSGFRAISREAAMRLNIVSSFSYTIEMLIQAGKRNMVVNSIPVAVNPKTRESRLFTSIPRFLERSLTTMVRIYAMYKPLRFFFYTGTALSIVGIIPISRFLYFYLNHEGAGHIQSLVLGGVFLMMGFLTYCVGLVADLISGNRQLLEMTLERVRRLELEREQGQNQEK